MLTQMSEEDWDVVLMVFRAVLPRRGDKGRDDRKFLEALHHSQHHVAGTAGRVRRLERGLEALLAAQSVGGV